MVQPRRSIVMSSLVPWKELLLLLALLLLLMLALLLAPLPLSRSREKCTVPERIRVHIWRQERSVDRRQSMMVCLTHSHPSRPCSSVSEGLGGCGPEAAVAVVAAVAVALVVVVVAANSPWDLGVVTLSPKRERSFCMLCGG